MIKRLKRSETLLPNENEENVQYEHNQPGALPATFNDVDDHTLRTYNRGAVLANIVERYIDQKLGAIPAKDMTMCMREVSQYLHEITPHEVDDAKASMVEHLRVRGLLNAYTTA